MNTETSIETSDYSKKELHSILHRREWTYVIDMTLAYFLSYLINILDSKFIPSRGFPYGEIVGLLYIIFKDSISGKSIGKALTGLRVIDAKEEKPVGFGVSIKRNFLFIIPIFPLVELIVANCRKDKRRLGDLIAGTSVVKTNKSQLANNRP